MKGPLKNKGKGRKGGKDDSSVDTANASLKSKPGVNADEGEEREQQETGENRKEDEGQVTTAEIPTDVYTTAETKETVENIIAARGYVMQDKLGSGAFAIVYKAMKISDKTFTACKVMEIRRRKKKRLNDLKHELYVLQKCRHPNIVGLYQHFIIDDKVYIFMEFASGGTLSDLVRKRGPLRERAARRSFREITNAIRYMHSKGISHRDLKLGNILLTADGQAKVTDFGLSRVSYRKDKGIIYCTSYCGTEPYMAPEILRKDEDGKRLYDPMIADIWALGVCLYAIINKAYPFNPEDKDMMVSNQMLRKWKFVKKQRQKLTEEVKGLIRHMLEPEVKTRITILGILSHPWMGANLEDDQDEISNNQQAPTENKGMSSKKAK